MSEELIQRNLIEAPEKMGDWNFYNIGATTLKALKGAKIIPDKDYEAYEGKKPDALIVKKPIIIAAIEYKTPQELRTEKQIAKAIQSTYNDFYSLGNIANRGIHTTMFIYKSTDTSSMML